ncbi:MAG: hypothetical protein ACREGJ_05135 [Candidatus Saccharimonadales bacterium]
MSKDKITKHFKATLSQYHSNQMAETIKRGMLNRAKSGYAITRPPLGYSTTETPGLYQLDSNGRSARSALQPLAKGEANLGTVVAYSEMFYHVMTGIEHSGTTWIERIVSNPYYCGYISYDGQLYPGLHKPLITVDEQRTLAEILNKHNKNNSLKPFDRALQSH